MALDLEFKPFSGVGIVTMYERGAGGLIGGGYDLGEAPAFNIGQSNPTDEMKTSRDASRGVAFRMTQSKGATLQIDLNTLTDYTLGLLTNGVWTNIAASAAVDDFVAPTGLQVGQVIKLPAQNVTAVSVVDSTVAGAKTLPPASYDLDPFAGTIVLKDLETGGPYVQPFKPEFTPGAVQVLGALKAPDTDFKVLLNGENAYDGSKVLVDIFKFRFGADGDSQWISESYGKWTLKGSVLKDETRSAAAAGGQYYSLTKPVVAS